MLQSIGSQRVWHDWATELMRHRLKLFDSFIIKMTNCTSHSSAYPADGEVVISVSNWSLVEIVTHVIEKMFWHVHKFPNN